GRRARKTGCLTCARSVTREPMPGIFRSPALTAFAVSGPLIALVLAGRFAGSDVLGHASAFAAVVLGLPWVVPAFVAIAVVSAPIFVALHIAGHPQELMPWLSCVILLAGIVASHLNAALLLWKIQHRRARSLDAGLADFLFRSPARAG